MADSKREQVIRDQAAESTSDGYQDDPGHAGGVNVSISTKESRATRNKDSEPRQKDKTSQNEKDEPKRDSKVNFQSPNLPAIEETDSTCDTVSVETTAVGATIPQAISRLVHPAASDNKGEVLKDKPDSDSLRLPLRRSVSASVERLRPHCLPAFMSLRDPFTSILPECPKQAFLSVDRCSPRALVCDSDEFGFTTQKSLPKYYYSSSRPGKRQSSRAERNSSAKKTERKKVASLDSPRCFANPKNNFMLLTPVLEYRFKNGTAREIYDPEPENSVMGYSWGTRCLRYDVDDLHGVEGVPQELLLRRPQTVAYMPGGAPSSSLTGADSSSGHRKKPHPLITPLYYGQPRPWIKSHSCVRRPVST